MNRSCQLCCLNSNKNFSHSTFKGDLAVVFHLLFSMFNDRDIVPSDVLAGMILVSRYHKKQRQECVKNQDVEGEYLHREFLHVRN